MSASNNSNSAAAGQTIREGGFIARLFAYAFFYVPLTAVYAWLMIMSKSLSKIDLSFLTNFFPINDFTGTIIVFAIFLLPTAIPFILWERSVRKFRRKHGLSIWKNITAELEQMEVDQRVAKEHKAFVNNGLVKEAVVDKGDIGYWHGLFEKGAITKEQFEAKRAELLL
ncbi:MAG: SHOCT domain-containing protein [Sulfurimonas sp.]|nr:SHOCT domain-containing protein [Sulfurimonas sp.]